MPTANTTRIHPVSVNVVCTDIGHMDIVRSDISCSACTDVHFAPRNATSAEALRQFVVQ